MHAPAPLGYRLSDVWSLCDAFDKCRGPLLNAFLPIYLLYLPLILWRLACPSLASGLGASLAWRSKTRVLFLSCLLSLPISRGHHDCPAWALLVTDNDDFGCQKCCRCTNFPHVPDLAKFFVIRLIDSRIKEFRTFRAVLLARRPQSASIACHPLKFKNHNLNRIEIQAQWEDTLLQYTKTTCRAGHLPRR